MVWKQNVSNYLMETAKILLTRISRGPVEHSEKSNPPALLSILYIQAMITGTLF